MTLMMNKDVADSSAAASNTHSPHELFQVPQYGVLLIGLDGAGQPAASCCA